MSKYLYIVTNRENDYEHLSYHKTQRSAYYEIAKLSKIPFTKKTFNTIGSYGGWNSEQGNYFVLEKDLIDNKQLCE